MNRHKNENKARILVVDDEELIRTTLEIKLSPDFDVTIASSGHEAIDKINEQSFDVILESMVWTSCVQLANLPMGPM